LTKIVILFKNVIENKCSSSLQMRPSNDSSLAMKVVWRETMAM